MADKPQASQLESVMISSLPPGVVLQVSVARDGGHVRLTAELVTKGSDRKGRVSTESRHTLAERTGPMRQALDELSRWVTANMAEEVMRCKT